MCLKTVSAIALRKGYEKKIHLATKMMLLAANEFRLDLDRLLFQKSQSELFM